MSDNRNTHVFYHKGYVTRQDRNFRYGHKSGLVLFTGLPASGKSTMAHSLEKILFEEGVNVYVLDGDNIRYGLNADLGFSVNDRRENLRRVAEVSKLLVDAGMIVLASFVAPFKEDREYIQSKFDREDFVEVYVKCPVEICETRDPKGYIRKHVWV